MHRPPVITILPVEIHTRVALKYKPKFGFGVLKAENRDLRLSSGNADIHSYI
jgi:hypothetical protein